MTRVFNPSIFPIWERESDRTPIYVYNRQHTGSSDSRLEVSLLGNSGYFEHTSDQVPQTKYPSDDISRHGWRFNTKCTGTFGPDDQRINLANPALSEMSAEDMENISLDPSLMPR